MCLGDLARVVTVDGDRATVEIGGVRSTVSLAVPRAEGTSVAPGDLVVVSMGLVLAVTDDATEAASQAEAMALVDRREVPR
jgi:hydrogenase maturation factor